MSSWDNDMTVYTLDHGSCGLWQGSYAFGAALLLGSCVGLTWIAPRLGGFNVVPGWSLSTW